MALIIHFLLFVRGCIDYHCSRHYTQFQENMPRGNSEELASLYSTEKEVVVQMKELESV